MPGVEFASDRSGCSTAFNMADGSEGNNSFLRLFRDNFRSMFIRGVKFAM